MELSSIKLGDSRDRNNYPDKKVELTVTSPPYFCGKDYEADYSFKEYKEMLRSVFKNVAENTVSGGKICINIADIAAFSKVSGVVEESLEISRDIQDWMREENCYLFARTVWVKDLPWANSQHVCYHDKIPPTYVRQLPSFEYIWTYYKDSPKRPDLDGYNITEFVSKEDWKKWATGVWQIRSVQSNNYHEAMFPEEIVRRLVLLYSIPGDTVFDPFLGSGTSAVVAYKNGRNFAGIERDTEYWKLIEKNLAAVENCLERQFVALPKYKQETLDF